MPNNQYDIFDQQIGLDIWLQRDQINIAAGISGTKNTLEASLIQPNPISNPMFANSLESGEMGAVIGHGKTTFLDTQAGWLQGLDTDGLYKWIIGNSTNSIDWSVTAAGVLTIVGAINATSGTIGGFSIGTDYIRDVANSFGLASTVTGGDDVRFWAGATFANRATAPIVITEAGNLTVTGGTIIGGTIKTASGTGQRVEILGSNNQVHFYNASNVEVATFGVSGSPSDVINITSPSAAAVHPITIIQNGADTQGSISITNEDNGAGARGIEILQKSDKEAIYVSNTSTSSGKSLYATHAGTNDCGYFEITNNTNTSYCLAANHSGLGNALRVIQQATANTAAAVSISQTTTSSGNGITLDVTNTSATSVGIEINHDGAGRGMHIHCDKTTSSAFGLYVEHYGTGEVVRFEMNGSSSTNPVIKLGQTSVTSTNFRLYIDMDGTRIWRSNGTDPNGNLSGTAGDICLNGNSNKPAYCTGTTNWTDLV